MRWILSVLLSIHAIGSQATMQNVTLKRFEVIRVNSDGIRRLPESLRVLFADPVPDGELVASVAEATKRVSFSPRLLNGKTPARIFVTTASSEEARINVAILTAALRDAQVRDVTVPATWDGVVIRLRRPPGVLADYGDFYLAQSAPSTLTASDGFPLPQFFEIAFRTMGIDSAEARALRDKFAINASS